MRQDERIPTASRRLAEDLRLYPWQRSVVPETMGYGAALGAVVNGKSCDHPGGFAFSEEGLVCVLEGYLVRTLSDCGVGSLIATGKFAEAAAMVYRLHGEAFAEHLEGPFTVAIHDSEKRRVLLANGRFASSHLYVAHRNDDFAAATLLGPLAACGMFDPEIDVEALGHMLSYGLVMGTDTLLDGVEALEPGSVGVLDLDTMDYASRRYWSFGSLGGHRHGLSLDRHTAEVGDTLTAAADRITRRSGRYVSGLSGGLDSRLVTALASTCDPEMKIWTYGTPDSSDMTTAARIAAHLGREHLTFPSDPERTPEHAEMYATTVDGCITTEFAFRLARTVMLMDSADIVLNGFAGDAIVGGSMLGPRLGILARNVKRRRLGGPGVVRPFLARNTEAETVAGYVADKYDHATRLTGLLSHRPEPMSERILRDVRAMDGDVPMELRAEQWIFDNRVTRWTLMGVLSDRQFYSDGSLFYDYEVLERCMSTPHDVRQENLLYSRVFKAVMPEMGAIPNGNTGLRADASPLRSRIHSVSDRVKRRLARSGKRALSTGDDQNHWVRTVCRGFYLDLLRDPRTLDRPCWDGGVLRDLIDGHMDGSLNMGKELGLAASVELFARRWIDGRSRTGTEGAAVEDVTA